VAVAEPDEAERKEAAGTEQPLTVATLQARAANGVKMEILLPLAALLYDKIRSKN